MRILELFTMVRAAMLLLALSVAVLIAAAPAQADTTNYAVTGNDMVLVPLHLDGQFTATTADAATIKLPFAARVVGVSATARASGGTSPTLTVMVEDDGTDILSSAISVTAGTVSEGTVSAPIIADESELTVDLVLGGTSPTWDDIDVLITLIRR